MNSQGQKSTMSKTADIKRQPFVAGRISWMLFQFPASAEAVDIEGKIWCSEDTRPFGKGDTKQSTMWFSKEWFLASCTWTEKNTTRKQIKNWFAYILLTFSFPANLAHEFPEFTFTQHMKALYEHWQKVTSHFCSPKLNSWNWEVSENFLCREGGLVKLKSRSERIVSNDDTTQLYRSSFQLCSNEACPHKKLFAQTTLSQAMSCTHCTTQWNLTPTSVSQRCGSHLCGSRTKLTVKSLAQQKRSTPQLKS